ncbi:unnamed protein product [Rodentolepis nana]|uniref:t-SNARE coiled-coil homology domain-containing protein n=1 Tax=Rodentolepis nana TaxID=102285 RepID=A0A0R3TFL9_RODNA|nr:unnamed protein product [Rodentolepis nana]
MFSKSTGRHFSNKFEYTSRRQSVTPSGKSIRRHTYEGSASPPSEFLTSISPPISPLHKPKESSDLFATKFVQLSSLLGIKRKEALQQEYFDTWDRHVQLVNEFREIVKIVEHMENVYENSKNTHMLDRFYKLKSCVRRTHMFLQVCSVHSSLGKDIALYYSSDMQGSESDLSFQRSLQRGSVISSQAKEAEALRQKEEAFERMDLEQVANAIKKMKDENEMLTMESKLLLAELKWLCDRYAEIRHINLVAKYYFLKRIIRKVIYGDTQREIQ